MSAEVIVDKGLKRKEDIARASDVYGTLFVHHNSRRIARIVASHYVTKDNPVDALTVRTYNRTINKMTQLPLIEVLKLIPFDPPELRQTDFGQVIISETVYVSAAIYACIVSSLTALKCVSSEP